MRSNLNYSKRTGKRKWAIKETDKGRANGKLEEWCTGEVRIRVFPRKRELTI